jgi:oxysterol-binding protein-related protein 9/10/11
MGVVNSHVYVLIAFRFVPRYFEKDIQSGVPTLTQAGKGALEEELKYEDGDPHDNDGDGGSTPSAAS